jgi:hypothetical protein
MSRACLCPALAITPSKLSWGESGLVWDSSGHSRHAVVSKARETVIYCANGTLEELPPAEGGGRAGPR